MAEGINTKVAMLGSADYRREVAALGRAHTVLTTELKATMSAFAGNEDSMEALTAKSEGLQKIYDKEAEKVALISTQLEAAKEKYGENSTQVDNLQIALNRATTTMNQTGNELASTKGELAKAGTATDELGEATKETTQAVAAEGEAAEDSGEKTGRMGAALQKTGDIAKAGAKVALEALAASFAAVGAAAAAAIVQTFKWAQQAGEMADDVLTLSAQTGVSAQTLQRWRYAAEFTDTSVETMTGSMAKMIKQMGQAADGSKGAQEKFDGLGVSIRDKVTGRLRDSEDVFWDAIGALGRIGSESERDAAAMEIFGKSAQELNPLIAAGRSRMEGLGDEAERMGVVFSGKALDAMGLFDDSMQRFKQTATGMENAIGLAAIPMFQPLVERATGSMAKVSTALQDGLQPGELDALANDLMGVFGDALTDVGDIATKGVPILSKALTTMATTAAKGLPKMAKVLLPAATDLLSALLDGVVDNSDEIGAMAAELITMLVEYLVANAPKMVDAAGDIVENLTDGLLEGDSLSRIVSGAVTMLAKLAAALISNAGVLLGKGPEIVGQLIKGILSVDWGAVALQLVASLGEAIASVFTNANDIAKVYEQQFGATQDAYDAFKVALDKADANLASSTQDAEAKKALATELLNLYSQLEQKDVRTDVDLTLMAGYAQQIAELYPTLGQYIDPTTGLFTENTAAIQANINAMAQLALVQGYQDYLTDLGGQLAKANIALDEGTRKLGDQYAAFKAVDDQAKTAGSLYSKVFEEAGSGIGAFSANLTDVYNTLKNVGGYTDPLSEYVQVLSDGTVVLKDGADAAMAYSTAQTQLAGAVGTAANAADEQSGVYLTLQTETQKLQTNMETAKANVDAVAKALQDETAALNAVPPAAAGAGAAGKQAGDEMSAGADAALDAGDKWHRAGEQMAAGKETADAAAAGAEEAGAQVQTAADTITSAAEDIKGAQTAAEGAQAKIAELTTTIGTDAATALTTMTETAAAIKLTVDGMIEAIEQSLTDGEVTLAAAGAALAAALVAAMGALLTVKQGTTYGEDMAGGVKTGLGNKKKDVGTAGGEVASAAKSAMADIVGKDGANFEGIGKDIDAGMARGIRNNASLVTAAAKAAARAAYQAAKDELEIKSPSRLMEREVGDQYGAGMALGIDRSADQVVRSARELSRLAASEATEGGGYLSAQELGGMLGAGSAQGTGIDYTQLGAAVADAMVERGIGQTDLIVDGLRLGSTSVADGVSQTVRRRSDSGIKGRGAQLVVVP